MTGRISALVAVLAMGLVSLACGSSDPGESEPSMEVVEVEVVDDAALREQAQGLFGELPGEMTSPTNPVTPVKVDLGRQLYFDPRLSKNQDISCNSCHGLATFGVDNQPTSPGHKGQLGGRNSPTVYNAGLHLAQFWDGRSPDLEDQAKGPVLNPVEMAMPSADAVVALLASIPGYVEGFAKAFPGEESPITYDNFALAVGAFERRLVTPSPFDAWLAGDDDALTPEQKQGIETFIASGCVTCHVGNGIGGGMYQKLGLVKAYPTEDEGRFAVTGNEADRSVFKVPSLRNITKTGPYFHDGSLTSLAEVVRLMSRHQVGRELSDEQLAEILAFLDSLTGTIDPTLVAQPELPPSGPDTPGPDPS